MPDSLSFPAQIHAPATVWGLEAVFHAKSLTPLPVTLSTVGQNLLMWLAHGGGQDAGKVYVRVGETILTLSVN
jgi:hypothetical protein